MLQIAPRTEHFPVHEARLIGVQREDFQTIRETRAPASEVE